MKEIKAKWENVDPSIYNLNKVWFFKKMTENEKIINLINELSNIFTMYFRYTW